MEGCLSVFETINAGERELQAFLGAVDQSFDSAFSVDAGSVWLEVLAAEARREGEGMQQFFRRVSIQASYRLSKKTKLRLPYAEETKAVVSFL